MLEQGIQVSNHDKKNILYLAPTSRYVYFGQYFSTLHEDNMSFIDLDLNVVLEIQNKDMLTPTYVEPKY